MYRIVSLFLGLALLTGGGYVTRYYWRVWFDAQMKESEAYSKKEMERWKKSAPKWSNEKLDVKKITMPPPNIPGRSGPRPSPGPLNPIN